MSANRHATGTPRIAVLAGRARVGNEPQGRQVGQMSAGDWTWGFVPTDRSP
jgi:hypothetical protein